MAERRQEREQHVAPLDQLEAVVLEVVDAPQLVGGDVLFRRARLAGDAAAAELVRVLAVADQRDVPDRAELLRAAERGGGSVDHLPCRTGLRLDGNPAGRHQRDRQRRRCAMTSTILKALISSLSHQPKLAVHIRYCGASPLTCLRSRG